MHIQTRSPQPGEAAFNKVHPALAVRRLEVLHVNSEWLNTEDTENPRELQRNPGFSSALYFFSIQTSAYSVAFLGVLCVKFRPLFAFPCRTRKIIEPW